MSFSTAEVYFMQMQSSDPSRRELYLGLTELVRGFKEIEQDIHGLGDRLSRLEKKIK